LDRTLPENCGAFGNFGLGAMSDVSPSCAPGLKEQSTAFIRAMCGQAAAAFSQQTARFVRRPIIASEPTPGAPTNGVVGGVLAGYNWQSGPLVLGIEADIGWTNAVGHGTAVIITTTTTPRLTNFIGRRILSERQATPLVNSCSSRPAGLASRTSPSSRA
jgi:hypothetical protein